MIVLLYLLQYEQDSVYGGLRNAHEACETLMRLAVFSRQYKDPDYFQKKVQRRWDVARDAVRTRQTIACSTLGASKYIPRYRTELVSIFVVPLSSLELLCTLIAR